MQYLTSIKFPEFTIYIRIGYMWMYMKGYCNDFPITINPNEYLLFLNNHSDLCEYDIPYYNHYSILFTHAMYKPTRLSLIRKKDVPRNKIQIRKESVIVNGIEHKITFSRSHLYNKLKVRLESKYHYDMHLTPIQVARYFPQYIYDFKLGYKLGLKLFKDTDYQYYLYNKIIIKRLLHDRPTKTQAY